MADFNTDPVSTVEEMGYYLANDVRAQPEHVVAWLVSVVTKPPGFEGTDNVYIVNRFSHAKPDIDVVYAQVSCIMTAVAEKHME